jgi:flavin-dependent dehydrogenase
MYDAIVVGARCAGSPTALLLARNGYRVLLVDKASFPSDTMSTHYIHQPGVACLQRFGLLDRLLASQCPPVTTFTFDAGPVVLTGSPPPSNGVTQGFCPRRKVLDQILAEAAVAAGAELRPEFTVKELLWEAGRVTGISR